MGSHVMYNQSFYTQARVAVMKRWLIVIVAALPGLDRRGVQSCEPSSDASVDSHAAWLYRHPIESRVMSAAPE